MPCVFVELDKLPCEGCAERTSANGGRCPAQWLFQHFGDKWTLPILATLHQEPLRFSQFRRALPALSERMLILTLNKLERNGFITRSKTDGALQQSSYMLTPRSRSLLEQISNLHQWMAENSAALQAAYDAAQRSEDTI